MKNGNQIATIVLDQKDADEILELNKIRIGLSVCQVQQRVEVLKCYRCWSYDHFASNCTGEDRSQKCHICAQDDHKAEKCTNDAFCPHCNNKGHRAGSGKCKLFQQALAKARKRNTRRSLEINR